MRSTFNVAVFIILAMLLANRAVMRAQAGEPGTLSCSQGSELTKIEALARGFTEIGARSQGENFLSACLVTGHGEIGSLVARD